MSGHVFELGDFSLASGQRLTHARLVYQTYGTLAPDRSNVILYPTSYGAQHTDIEWLVKPDGILDPTRYFVVIPNMFGNGLSSSPSHSDALAEVTPPVPDTEQPVFSHHDNLAAQERLLREAFGIERLALVYGWSMGAQQAYHWAVFHPERVERLVAVCGTARTTPHNRLFLASLEAALHADPTWDGQRFCGVPERGLRAFARIYASWAASQAFYKQQLYLGLGYSDLEDYLVRAWEPSYRRRHPLDLLAMLRTWRDANVADHPEFKADLGTALGAIRAKCLVLASATDLYFTPEDCAAEAALIAGARYAAIPSIWGHRAGNPYQNPEDARFIRNAVHEHLRH